MSERYEHEWKDATPTRSRCAHCGESFEHLFVTTTECPARLRQALDAAEAQLLGLQVQRDRARRAALEEAVAVLEARPTKGMGKEWEEKLMCIRDVRALLSKESPE